VEGLGHELIRDLKKKNYCKDSVYSMFKDKLQNCTLNEFD